MKNSLSVILISIISFSTMSAQSRLKQVGSNSFNKSTPNFYDVQKTFNEYFEKKSASQKDKEHGRDGEWKQFKRWEWFVEQRVYPSGNFFNPEILVEEYFKYKAAHLNKISQGSRATNWTYFGPHGTAPYYGGAGRINCMAINPNNSNLLYIGAACGGLWKSVDGGNNWSTNTDLLPALSISEIIINPLNTNIMYLATGDKYSAGWGGNYSAGLMKSIDGGTTWNSTNLNFTQAQTSILERAIINPVNPNIIIVATNTGIFRSSDGASTWTNVKSGIFYDLEYNPSNPNVVYASDNHNIYRSDNGGVTWNTLLINIGNGGRNSIAVTPADTNVIYAWCSGGIFLKSANGGTTFNLMGSPDGITSPYNFYDQVLEVSPANSNVIFAGGAYIGKSTDGGATWFSPLSNFIHVDNHNFVFLPGNESVIFSCNDGGLYKTTNGGSDWSFFNNGLDIKQYYRMGCSALNSDLIYAGAQDNGTDRIIGAGVDIVGDGDGTECLVDYSNTDIVYSSYHNGTFSKSINGGNSFNQLNITTNAGSWVTPFVIHPSNPLVLFAGYSDVYKTIDGGNTWNAISNNIDNGNLLTSLVVSFSNPHYIYTSSEGNLFRTINDGVSWNLITHNLPVNNAAITGISINPTNPDNVWVTFSGYSTGKKVFKTNDGGATWINISGTLPNIPINCIVYQNGSVDGIYIGTDFGVFYRNANMNDWVYYNTGLPNVIIYELEIQYSVGKLRAATYGRGIWESDLFPSTDIEQLNNVQSIAIYPNPANDQLTIEGVVFTIGEKINGEIYNVIGEKIFDGPIAKNKIDIRNIKPGTYVLKITTSKGFIARKFIKQ